VGIVGRLVLAVWIAAFCVQTTDMLALVASDDCTEDVRGTAADPCPEGCPQCLCCARGPVFVPELATAESVTQVAPIVVSSPVQLLSDPNLLGVYHVPKHS
jgi:hypothetical protein